MSSPLSRNSGVLDAWSFLRDREIRNPDLTAAERDCLKSATAQDVVAEIKLLETTHTDQSRTRQCLDKLQPFITWLDKFGVALDVFANADAHGILSIVWGSLRLLLVVAKDLQHYFEEYLDFLSRIGRLIGRLQAYERLAPASIQLNHSLIRVFEEFFAFFRMTKSLFGTERAKSGIRRFVGPKLLRSNLWNAFKKETTTKIKAIEGLCQEADEEARLAISERQGYHLENITAKLDTHVLDEGKKGSQSDIKGFGQWLSPIAVDEDLYALGQGRMEDSCGWVLKTTEFVRWEEHIGSPEKLQVLWVSGLPGSGKTHISSFLVDYLQKFGTVGYFFCKTADQNKRTAESIIRTWTWQLFSSTNNIPEELFNAYRKGAAATKGALSDCLKRLAAVTDPGILIVDGLDECILKEQEEMLIVCRNLVEHVKIIIVSRDEHQIRLGVQKAAGRKGFSHIRITADQNRQSIESFIWKRLEEIPELETPDDPDEEGYVIESKSFIANNLLENAAGVFLWARLMLEHLSEKISVTSMMEALAVAPNGLGEMYKRTIEDIGGMASEEHRNMALKILRWILFAVRPLSIPELQIALAIDPGQKAFDPARKVRSLESLIPRLCRCLVEIDQQTRTVGLVHASVKDYLLNIGQYHTKASSITFDLHAGNASLSAVCLTYLNFDRDYFHVDADQDSNSRRFMRHLERNPFLEYSSVFWIQHMSSVSKSWNSDYGEIPVPLDISLAGIVRWLQIFKALDAAPCPGLSLSKDLFDDLLMSAVIWGLKALWTEYAKQILTEGSLDVLRCHLGPTARDPVSRWRRFLCGGSVDFDMFQPIIVAAHFDFLSVLQEQLRRGCAVNTRSPRGGIVLFFAARTDAADCVKVLIQEGADVNDKVYNFGVTPLRGSVHNDLFHILSDKIQYTPNPFTWDFDAYSKSDRTNASYLAAHLLLDAGANTRTADDYWGNSILHDLPRAHHDDVAEAEIASALLEHNADLRKQNKWSQRPLYLAAQYGTVRLAAAYLAYEQKKRGDAAVKELLDYSRPGIISTALVEACSASRVSTRRSSQVGLFLILKGASVNIPSALNGYSPLQVALSGARNLIPALLSYGADTNVQDRNGNTPLHEAAKLDLNVEIELLLAHECHVDALNSDGRTPAVIAFEARNLNALKTLLRHGAQKIHLERFGDVSTDSALEAAMFEWIKRQESSLAYYPKTPRDILEAYFLLDCATHGRFSTDTSIRTLLCHILESAQYWIRSSVTRRETLTFNQHNCTNNYLASPPIVGRMNNPVRKIIFCVHSHDQGWSDYKSLYGTYERSSSWTEARRLIGGSELDPHQSTIYHNLHAHRDFREYTKVWGVDSPRDDEWTLHGRRWIKGLKPGDVVTVFPLAEFPGWLNVIKYAKIEVYSSILPLRPLSAHSGLRALRLQRTSI